MASYGQCINYKSMQLTHDEDGEKFLDQHRRIPTIVVEEQHHDVCRAGQCYRRLTGRLHQQVVDPREDEGDETAVRVVEIDVVGARLLDDRTELGVAESTCQNKDCCGL